MAAKTTLASLSRDIATEADAYAYLESLRWPDGVRCPRCDGDDVYLIVPKNGTSRRTASGSMSERRVWNCRTCRRQFSAISGTVMHGTKAPVRVWVLAVFDMIAAKNGISAREVERKYGVCARTAWFMLHRIREAMANDGLVGSMRGTIVADETWIGGDPKNRHVAHRLMERGFGNDGSKTAKTSVLSLIDATTGEARSAVVPNVQGATLRKVIAEQVDMAGSTLWTDQGKQYKVLGREFSAHESVNHAESEYVRGNVTTNRAEGFFGNLKRSIDGTHHHVSVEHLRRYLAEHDFRYSTCKMSDGERMALAIKRGDGKRLSYKRVRATG